METTLSSLGIYLGMSNCDHTIDDGLAEALRANPRARARYSGWNFCAYVWVEPDDDHFSCEVWRHNEPVKTIRRSTLRDIMTDVSNEFGWD